MSVGDRACRRPGAAPPRRLATMITVEIDAIRGFATARIT
jgi:hypothetical protein